MSRSDDEPKDPVMNPLEDPFTVPTHYWHTLSDGRIQCDLCPRACKLRDGQRGLCYVRARTQDQVVLTSYGRSSGFVIDPIEKKPLNHFYPGSSVLSFGTAGCNLSCKFCQNWDISKSREMDTLASHASPEQLAQAAVDAGCTSIAFTYNDPVIFHEYAIDVAAACREKGIHTVAVTAGYICPEPRKAFFSAMDAVNVDLKAFTESFYWKITGAHLAPVLDTLCYLREQTSVWFEITTLLIPGKNDSEAELRSLCDWVMAHLGPDVPIHFSAFHPDYKMRDIPATPHKTLTLARNIAMEAGIHFAYTGNVHDEVGDTTFCSNCKKAVIKRDWYRLLEWHLVDGCCQYCGTVCPGHFESKPGDWGGKRVQLRFPEAS